MLGFRIAASPSSESCLWILSRINFIAHHHEGTGHYNIEHATQAPEFPDTSALVPQCQSRPPPPCKRAIEARSSAPNRSTSIFGLYQTSRLPPREPYPGLNVSGKSLVSARNPMALNRRDCLCKKCSQMYHGWCGARLYLAGLRILVQGNKKSVGLPTPSGPMIKTMGASDFTACSR